MDQVEVEGLQIAYEREGHGPVLALAHGFVGDAASTWSHQLNGLADTFCVVAWDAPGCGRSSRPPASFRLSDYADCFAAFVRALGFNRAHLGGISFGGSQVLATFQRHPGIAQSLVLLSSYAGWAGSLTPDEVEARLRFCQRVSELPPEEFERAMLPSMFSPSANAEAVTEFGASVRAFDPAGFRAMAGAVAGADLREMLATIDVPTLILSGDEDVRAPMGVARAIHAAIPGSLLVVLPRVGHVCTVEAPELVNREIRGFLRGVVAVEERRSGG